MEDALPIFMYEKKEYDMVKHRLETLIEEFPEARERLATLMLDTEPGKAGLSQLVTTSLEMAIISLEATWAKEALDKLEAKVKEQGPIDINAFPVNDDGVPWLFMFIEEQRRGFLATLLDAYSRKVKGIGMAGVLQDEVNDAMMKYVDEFIQMAPCLRNIDLGKKDPLFHVL